MSSWRRHADDAEASNGNGWTSAHYRRCGGSSAAATGPPVTVQDLQHTGQRQRKRAREGPVFACWLAEAEGFEPSMQLITACSLSRGVPSTTRPRLQPKLAF